jgi:hypothetical protein
MTDKTKEELEDISVCISAIMDSSAISYMQYDQLYEKVNAMIDNYSAECPETRDVNCINPCPKCGEHHD